MKHSIFLSTIIITVSAILQNDVTMEVDGEEIKTGKMFLFKMQDFVSKLIKASGKYSKTRVRWRTEEQGIKINEFFQELCSVLAILKRSELNVVAEAIQHEITVRRKTKKYGPLLRIPVVNRSLNTSLETLKREPPRVWEIISQKLKALGEFSTVLSDSPDEFTDMKISAQDWTNELVSRAKHIFGQKTMQFPIKFHKIIDDLEEYLIQNHVERRQNKAKQQSFNAVILEKLIRDAMRIVDENVNLDKEKMDYIELSLQYLWSGSNKYSSEIDKSFLEYVGQNQILNSKTSNINKPTKPRSPTTTEVSAAYNNDQKKSQTKQKKKQQISEHEDEPSQSELVSSDETVGTQTAKTNDNKPPGTLSTKQNSLLNSPSPNEDQSEIAKSLEHVEHNQILSEKTPNNYKFTKPRRPTTTELRIVSKEEMENYITEKNNLQEITEKADELADSELMYSDETIGTRTPHTSNIPSTPPIVEKQTFNRVRHSYKQTDPYPPTTKQTVAYNNKNENDQPKQKHKKHNLKNEDGAALTSSDETTGTLTHFTPNTSWTLSIMQKEILNRVRNKFKVTEPRLPAITEPNDAINDSKENYLTDAKSKHISENEYSALLTSDETASAQIQDKHNTSSTLSNMQIAILNRVRNKHKVTIPRLPTTTKTDDESDSELISSDETADTRAQDKQNTSWTMSDMQKEILNRVRHEHKTTKPRQPTTTEVRVAINDDKKKYLTDQKNKQLTETEDESNLATSEETTRTPTQDTNNSSFTLSIVQKQRLNKLKNYYKNTEPRLPTTTKRNVALKDDKENYLTDQKDTESEEESSHSAMVTSDDTDATQTPNRNITLSVMQKQILDRIKNKNNHILTFPRRRPTTTILRVVSNYDKENDLINSKNEQPSTENEGESSHSASITSDEIITTQTPKINRSLSILQKNILNRIRNTLNLTLPRRPETEPGVVSNDEKNDLTDQNNTQEMSENEGEPQSASITSDEVVTTQPPNINQPLSLMKKEVLNILKKNYKFDLPRRTTSTKLSVASQNGNIKYFTKQKKEQITQKEDQPTTEHLKVASKTGKNKQNKFYFTKRANKQPNTKMVKKLTKHISHKGAKWSQRLPRTFPKKQRKQPLESIKFAPSTENPPKPTNEINIKNNESVPRAGFFNNIRQLINTNFNYKHMSKEHAKSSESLKSKNNIQELSSQLVKLRKKQEEEADTVSETENGEDIGEKQRRRSAIKQKSDDRINDDNERSPALHYKNTEASVNLPECNSINSNCDIKMANLAEWSSESAALYSALELQSRKLPLGKILRHEDVLFLKKLNISVSYDDPLERRTQSAGFKD